MNRKITKFISYYKPYMGVFLLDMAAAIVVASISLIFPLIIRYITGEVLVANVINYNEIYILGAVMFVGLLIEYGCNFYIAYQGHVMGAMMEKDLRKELFEHYQKLSFSFYDEQKTGQLMSRLTNDLFSLTELYHHGPEDIVISLIKIVGAFIILLGINIPLTLMVFACIPVMIVLAIYFNRKMKKAFKVNKEKIGDINASIEDNLSGIRVVKSFGNEAIEMKKFKKSNLAYLSSKRSSYRYMGGVS